MNFYDVPIDLFVPFAIVCLLVHVVDLFVHFAIVCLLVCTFCHRLSVSSCN